MSPITEIAILQTTSQYADKDAIFQEALSTVSKQPGFIATYYGMGVEQNTQMYWLIDWDSIEDHKTFMASPQYKPFMTSLGSIITSPADMRHVNLNLDTSNPQSASVTEVFSMYLPETATDGQKQELTQAWLGLEKGIREADGFEGVLEGEVVESIPHKSLGGAKGYVQMALVGWKSVEAHQAFRDSDAFKSTIGPIRTALSGSDMGHVVLQKYQIGSR